MQPSVCDVCEPGGSASAFASMETGDGDASALWYACEAVAGVQRKPQLFLWMQTHLRRFVPHDLAVCASARPVHHGLAFHVFHALPLPVGALACLADAGGPLIRSLISQWQRQPATASVIDLHQGDAASDIARSLMWRHGYDELLVHAVPGTRDAQGLDSLFVFGSQQHRFSPAEVRALGVLLPQLHMMSLLVSANEEGRDEARGRTPYIPGVPSALTQRERQILLHVREGQRNAQIAVALGISALTVKNHLQNILRKLGANNRAQAVAQAMSKNLLGSCGGAS